MKNLRTSAHTHAHTKLLFYLNRYISVIYLKI